MKILVIAGKKQSGKTTAGNFVVGYTITQLARAGHPYLPTQFLIDEVTGDLVVDTLQLNFDDSPVYSRILDLYSQDPDFLQWAHDCMYPHVKTYAYADLIKAVAIQVFGLTPDQVNGTDEQKNEATHIKWKDMCALLPPRVVADKKKSGKYDKKMSGREFLQYFGSEVCRKIYSDCWVHACFSEVFYDKPNLAVVTDARLENEIKIPKTYRSDDIDVKIIKLERAPKYDVHDSETGLDKLHNNNFDLVIPKNVTIREKNQLILDALYQWKWFDKHIDLET